MHPISQSGTFVAMTKCVRLVLLITFLASRVDSVDFAKITLKTATTTTLPSSVVDESNCDNGLPCEKDEFCSQSQQRCRACSLLVKSCNDSELIHVKYAACENFCLRTLIEAVQVQCATEKAELPINLSTPESAQDVTEETCEEVREQQTQNLEKIIIWKIIVACWSLVITFQIMILTWCMRKNAQLRLELKRFKQRENQPNDEMPPSYFESFFREWRNSFRESFHKKEGDNEATIDCLQHSNGRNPLGTQGEDTPMISPSDNDSHSNPRNLVAPTGNRVEHSYGDPHTNAYLNDSTQRWSTSNADDNDYRGFLHSNQMEIVSETEILVTATSPTPSTSTPKQAEENLINPQRQYKFGSVSNLDGTGHQFSHDTPRNL